MGRAGPRWVELDTLWWALAVVLIVAGLAGTVLPALPGTAFILGGIVLAAWIDGFARVGTFTLVLVACLALLSWVLEHVAGLLGAQKAGASRWALAGAMVGTVLGLLMGLVGVLFMPLLGAALGEFWAQTSKRRRAAAGVDASGSQQADGLPPATGRGSALGQDLKKSLHVGVSAWLGMLAGLLAKVVLGFMMVGVFLVALVW